MQFAAKGQYLRAELEVCFAYFACGAYVNVPWRLPAWTLCIIEDLKCIDICVLR